jgi:hypothetical protein
MVKLVSLLASLSLIFSASGLAADSRQDLGINGCSVRDTATYQSGTDLLTIVACEGPLGVFTSTDFGSTWSFAEGGSYSSGEAFGVAATPFGVYALRSTDSLMSSLKLSR